MTADTQTQVTFVTLLQAIEEAPMLTVDRRREMASALRTICRVLGTEPHLVPAQTRQLQVLISKALPAAIGLSATRWRNCKSLLRAALALIDKNALPARSRVVLLPAWRTLVEAPEARPMQRGIARFSKWCSADRIEPQQVCQELFDRFYEDLVEHCLGRDMREAQQVAGHAWNDAAAAVPGWPQVRLVIADRRRNPSLPWAAFPQSLSAEIDAYFAPRTSGDLRFDVTPIVFRTETAKGKRALLRQYATAVVESGVPAAELATLADLLPLDCARAGLKVLYERANCEKTNRIYCIATLLLNLARHEVKASPQVISGLAGFAANMRPRKTGMADKNRERLRPLKDPRQLDLLLGLPARLMRAACAVPVTTAAEARIAQHAVALEILSVAPMRISNVAALEVGRTLVLNQASGHINIPRKEVKNDVDLEIPLPAPTVAMLRLYLKRFHPLLAPPGCKMLFPSRDGGHKRSPVLGAQLSRRIGGECGIVFNPHLFRHLAAYIFLDANPGQYGVVKLLLGHKSIDTTINTYCGMEADAAFTSYAGIIGARRGIASGHWS